MNVEVADRGSARRVAVFGASNVTLGLPVIVDLLRKAWAAPGFRIMMAHGHGRSYGIPTRVLMRGLPGHVDASFLKSGRGDDCPQVLLTDIGNDLVYGVGVPQIANWVREISEKLADRNAEIVMTGLPLGSIRRLSRSRFLMFRTLFFPSSGLEYSQVFDLASELNETTREICHAIGGTFVEPKAEWYGMDPIHIRRSRRVEAWQYVLSHFTDWRAPASVRVSIADRCRLRFARAERDIWFGRESNRQQAAKARTLSDGTQIRFF